MKRCTASLTWGSYPPARYNVTGRENGALLVRTDGEPKRVNLALGDVVLVAEEASAPGA